MTDRQAPTAYETVASVTAALDQVEAELRHLRAHIAAVTQLALTDTDAEKAAIPGLSYCAARSAGVVAGTAGHVAGQMRDLATRQSGSGSVVL